MDSNCDRFSQESKKRKFIHRINSNNLAASSKTVTNSAQNTHR